ncbi:uncharacterized protein LOC131008196 [Salvia miltiorrhiza]|uniref:uncharacterized protein LOC131008196 n=1 Tax=Salvia miltiorrhiza TaxID=226208 RepID=UPI0025AB7772|nr:uncharacterized protein LOC131008196 [Salvia miltiorrhiza]
MAQRWFHNLKSSSLYSYGDLYLMFMRQFASSKRMGKTAISLMDVKQEPQESLREYVARFNMAVLVTPEAESQIKCYAFVRGLKQGPLFDALQITPPKEFDNIMAILPGYLQLEDAKAARRAEADKLRVKKGDNGTHPSDKHSQRTPYKGLPPRIPAMAVKTRSPSPGPAQTDRRNKGGDTQERHPLNRPADEIFHLVKDETWFRAP